MFFVLLLKIWGKDTIFIEYAKPLSNSFSLYYYNIHYLRTDCKNSESFFLPEEKVNLFCNW